MSMEASILVSLKAKQYSQITHYFESHGTAEHADVAMKWAVLYEAAPVVRELAYMGVSLNDHPVSDALADTIFGDPDDAVDKLNEKSHPFLIEFLVKRQIEYCVDAMAKMQICRAFLKPYYLRAIM